LPADKNFKLKPVMTESKTENRGAQPGSSRFFLRRRPFVPPGLTAQLIFWPLMLAGLALDLWSKKAVFNYLEHKPDNSISIIDGFLQLVIAQNNGAAFGLFSGRPYLLAAASIIALIVILVIFFFSEVRHTLIYIALALFAAGVCGNLYDRIFNDGFVRDFIDVYYRQYHWPAFNIADTILCIGIGILVLSTFFTAKPHRTHGQQHK
jgi:signal peptidase II